MIGSATPELVEIASVAGFDFVTFDAEHETLDDSDLTNCIRAAEAFGITPICRIAKDADRLLRLMDSGAQGVHVPRCTTAEDMERLVEGPFSSARPAHIFTVWDAAGITGRSGGR